MGHLEDDLDEGLRRIRALTFREFAQRNRDRCIHGFGHLPSGWSTSDWMVATLGELGEAANIVKKLNRHRDKVWNEGDGTLDELNDMLADEIADTFIYLDLLAQHLGLDMASIVIDKFNRTSDKIGYVPRLGSS